MEPPTANCCLPPLVFSSVPIRLAREQQPHSGAALLDVCMIGEAAESHEPLPAAPEADAGRGDERTLVEEHVEQIPRGLLRGGGGRAAPEIRRVHAAEDLGRGGRCVRRGRGSVRSPKTWYKMESCWGDVKGALEVDHINGGHDHGTGLS